MHCRLCAALRPNLILVYDALASGVPRQWEWNIHALNAMTVVSNQRISIQNNGQSLCVDMLAGPPMQFTQTNQFTADPETGMRGGPDPFGLRAGLSAKAQRYTLHALERCRSLQDANCGGPMEMRKIVDYIRENVRTYGMGATLHDIECRMVNKIVHFEILKGMTVRMQDVKDPGLFEAQGFDARFVGEDELARFAHDGAHDVSLDFLRRARARGDRCYALFDGEALAAYGWYSDLPTPIDEHFVLHFDPAWTYMYKGYTVPAYRGKRLHAVGMCRALRAVTEEGRNGLISWVFSNNFASLRSVMRMGYRIFGEAYVLRAGTRSFTYATSACRDYGFWVEPLDTVLGVSSTKRLSHQ